ncbi:hypothetical protein NHF46_00920 [Arthrobacter alpinus]|nr:hypothetical protein [Arthrobacter alpinus]
MPLIWQTDAFALATGYDEDANRYVGLWTPQNKGPAPAATDALLLVRPDIASKQQAAESQALSETPSDMPPGDDTHTPEKAAEHDSSRQTKSRFYGVKTLGADKIAMDFKSVAEEVLAYLRADANTKLVVRIEIEATDSTGFDEGTVRTVSENAHTLKFDQFGFEDS